MGIIFDEKTFSRDLLCVSVAHVHQDVDSSHNECHHDDYKIYTVIPIEKELINSVGSKKLDINDLNFEEHRFSRLRCYSMENFFPIWLVLCF